MCAGFVTTLLFVTVDIYRERRRSHHKRRVSFVLHEIAGDPITIYTAATATPKQKQDGR